MNAVLYAYPEPYDPVRHGPALPNSSYDDNLVTAPGFQAPPHPNRKATQNQAPPPLAGISQAYSLVINPSDTSQFFGIYQNNDVQLDIVLPKATDVTRYLYSPTVLPPGGACVETTTIHQRSPGTSTIHRHGWYNWCLDTNGDGLGEWAYIEDMNASFQNKYVRTFGGEPGISISLVTPNNGQGYGGLWVGHLYNFQVGGWEQKFSYNGNGTTYAPLQGWTAWESWNLLSSGNCPTVPSVRAQLIQLYVSWSGGVQYLEDFPQNYNHSTSSAYCWTNSGGTPYTFTFPTDAYGTWRADTPVP